MEKIKEIEVIFDFKANAQTEMNGKNGARLGMAQMIGLVFSGGGSYDGYKVVTEEHEYLLLISNGQSCCESWGYFASEDNFSEYIGSELLGVKFTDVALNTKALEESGYYQGDGGIQFVDFETDRGVIQFAVYNGHNGYYGHDIVFAKDNKILLSDVL